MGDGVAFLGDRCGRELGQLSEGEGVFWGQTEGQGGADLLWWDPTGVQRDTGTLQEDGQDSARASPTPCSKRGPP